MVIFAKSRVFRNLPVTEVTALIKHAAPLLSLSLSLSHSLSLSLSEPTTMRLLVLVVLAVLGGVAPSQAGGGAYKATAAADAPASSSGANNLTALMARKGCGRFASLLSSTGDAAKTYENNVASGLTVFCPTDAAVGAFKPELKNLSADATLSLLLYHAIPVYEPLQTLRSTNGVANTLATDGVARDFNLTVQNDGETVTLRTAAPAPARITSTILDNDPVAVFAIDAVLRPQELFPPPAAAPAPAPPAGPPDAGTPPAPEGPETPSPKKKSTTSSISAAGRTLVGRGTAAVVAAASLAAVLF